MISRMLLIGLLALGACQDDKPAPQSESKIIGGIPVTVPYEFFAGLTSKDSPFTFVVPFIEDNIVMTAAHCVEHGT